MKASYVGQAITSCSISILWFAYSLTNWVCWVFYSVLCFLLFGVLVQCRSFLPFFSETVILPIIALLASLCYSAVPLETFQCFTIPVDIFLERSRLKDWARAVIGQGSNRPWIFQSNGLGICLRHLVPPPQNLPLCLIPTKSCIWPQLLKNQGHNLPLATPKKVTQCRCVPRPCKAKTG